ncbi:hypothetical protein G6F56_005068 [Rhizopus delemar]|nr:hypothetical protein G6F56_005068 [Rhizopus delemar]
MTTPESFLTVYQTADHHIEDQSTEDPFPVYLDGIDTTLAPFCPTSAERVLKALKMAQIGPQDILVDLGSGDGRFVTCAVSEFDVARAVGIESDPELVQISHELSQRVLTKTQQERVEFIAGDLLDLPKMVHDTQWTVIVLFLLPDHTDKFSELLLQHYRQGAKIVSLVFNLNEIPELNMITKDEQEDIQEVKNIQEYTQINLLSELPLELVLDILSRLSFEELVQVQLTCQTLYRLAQDNWIWERRLRILYSSFTDIYAHNSKKLSESLCLPPKVRYCQAITLANWRLGLVQRETWLNMGHNHGEILSIKLRENLLVTLTEDNWVLLYQYNTDDGFQLQCKWYFGNPYLDNNRVECLDILPDIQILVIAQRGSKCLFFDINKGPRYHPIQVLKGGNHPWFVPDSIAVNQEYIAVAGRKPSAVFIWNWRKSNRLSNQAFDDQPRRLFLSGNHLIVFSTDGLLHVFDLLHLNRVITHYVGPCNLASVEYDTPHMILCPSSAHRIYHFTWPTEAHIRFDKQPKRHLICTRPLFSAASDIVTIALHQDRIATVNQHGQIALYALNGTTAARVLHFSDVQLLALGRMGLLYTINNKLCWLDFSCK